MTTTFDEKLEAYFGKYLGWGSVKVRDSKQLAGGISRETWKVSLEITADDGSNSTRDLVLSVDPDVALLESNRDTEIAMMRAFQDVPGVPVPEVICDEGDPQHLGSTFMGTSALSGITDIAGVLQPPYAQAGPQIARNIFTILGAVAAMDYRETSLPQLLEVPSPRDAALKELTHWEEALRKHSIGPTPITEMAIRYMKANLPVPEKVVVTHGDFRLGNCLYLPDGSISGVLDWEMAHFSDPHEDLAWALHRDWRPSAAQDKVAGHIEESEAIRIWEEAGGFRADPDTLRWWRLLSCVKMFAIYTTGAYGFLHSGKSDIVYALLSWSGLDVQEEQMIDLMGMRT